MQLNWKYIPAIAPMQCYSQCGLSLNSDLLHTSGLLSHSSFLLTIGYNGVGLYAVKELKLQKMSKDAKDVLYERGLIIRSTEPERDWMVHTNADAVIKAMEDYQLLLHKARVMRIRRILNSNLKSFQTLAEKHSDADKREFSKGFVEAINWFSRLIDK